MKSILFCFRNSGNQAVNPDPRKEAKATAPGPLCVWLWLLSAKLPSAPTPALTTERKKHREAIPMTLFSSIAAKTFVRVLCCTSGSSSCCASVLFSDSTGGVLFVAMLLVAMLP
ncbi:MAG: hypothetical protein P8077_08620, partial [Gammaproteobacteria bacterium]